MIKAVQDDLKYPEWIQGTIDIDSQKVYIVKTKLSPMDKIGGYKVRWKIGRDSYTVTPGLYAVGKPDGSSPVLVTANYKLTFDKLRQELSGLSLWIVVLDTKGINVWCAAGKGTFGTGELIKRIEAVNLDRVVSHRTIILPQLGASGVAAHLVTRATGFKVVYGPVRARDIKEFLNSGMNASEGMREVTSSFAERIVLTPVEIVSTIKYIPVIFGAFFILNLIHPGAINILETLKISLYNSIPYIVSLFIGAFLIPILLPYIPFNAFSLKGLILGLIWSGVVILFDESFMFESNLIVNTANLLLITSIISYLSFNFTGSTTYTSLSGVKKETKYIVPAVLVSSVLGIILTITGKIGGLL